MLVWPSIPCLGRNPKPQNEYGSALVVTNRSNIHNRLISIGYARQMRNTSSHWKTKGEAAAIHNDFTARTTICDRNIWDCPCDHSGIKIRFNADLVCVEFPVHQSIADDFVSDNFILSIEKDRITEREGFRKSFIGGLGALNEWFYRQWCGCWPRLRLCVRNGFPIRNENNYNPDKQRARTRYQPDNLRPFPCFKNDTAGRKKTDDPEHPKEKISKND